MLCFNNHVIAMDPENRTLATNTASKFVENEGTIEVWECPYCKGK